MKHRNIFYFKVLGFLTSINVCSFICVFFLGQNLSPRQTTSRRPQQSSTSRQTTSNGVPRAEPLKFEGEFDFEQANARFEQEIEKEFTDKLKISSDKQRSNKRNQSKDKQQQQQQQQHDLDSSLTNSQSMTLQDMQDQQHMLMKQKSLSTTNTDHDLSKDHQHHARDTHTMSAEEKNFYDKNISFFDRISCEANDKLQSKERKNWKEERKMNAETFGLIQRQQNDMMKSNYSRTYNNSNRYNNNNQNQNGSNSGRNYPRNYNSNGQQQHQQYRNSNSGNQMRQSQSQQQQRMTVGSGQRSTNYSRRNDMDDYNSMSQRGGQRRFGSR
jgi:protein LSM14